MTAIIDGHTHSWPRWPYPPAVPDPATRGSAEQLLFEMDWSGVNHALVIAACIGDNDDNNEYVARVARNSGGRLLHAVDADSRWSPHYHRAGADHRLRTLIETHRPAAVSHYLAKDNDGWLRTREADRFFDAIAEAGLPMSIAAPAGWHEDLRAIVRDHPTIPVVVQHLANVYTWPGGVDEALRLVLPGAAVPNLHVKVSSISSGAIAPWEYPHRERLHVIRAFHDEWGTDRLVWASDSPVSRHKGLSYQQTLELVRMHCTFFTDDELAAVLGRNLARILGIALPTASVPVREGGFAGV